MNPQRYALAEGRLALDWDNLQIELDGDYLRRHCRCATCRAQTLSATAATTATAETAAAPPVNVTISALSPLGYGVQLHFSDGHNRGIFPWSYLREIAAAHIAN